MSAAAVIAQAVAMGLSADAHAAAETAPWIALGVGVVLLAGRWLLRRGSRVTPLQPLPPDEAGDDTIEMLRGWDAALERLAREGERHG